MKFINSKFSTSDYTNIENFKEDGIYIPLKHVSKFKFHADNVLIIEKRTKLTILTDIIKLLKTLELSCEVSLVHEFKEEHIPDKSNLFLKMMQIVSLSEITEF